MMPSNEEVQSLVEARKKLDTIIDAYVLERHSVEEVFDYPGATECEIEADKNEVHISWVDYDGNSEYLKFPTKYLSMPKQEWVADLNKKRAAAKRKENAHRKKMEQAHNERKRQEELIILKKLQAKYPEVV